MKTPLPNSIPSLLGNVIPGKNVRIDGATSGTNTTTCGLPAKVGNGQPRVTLIKSGDSVSGIRVECSCGEVIELDCQY